MKQNKVTIFAVGGCGINIVSPLMKAATKDAKGFADLTFGMIDTSHSNLPDVGADSHFYHVGSRHELTDGSGKIRSTNVDYARQAVPQILAKWEPGDLSIVVHSGSGGSGSLIGNLLTQDLVSKGKNVVVILIASRTCLKEVDNVCDTIKTYQKVAVTTGRPVPCYYLDNKLLGMAAADSLARVAILFLTAVWSGENKGLDRKDLENFLNYDRVSQYKPAIVALEVWSGATVGTNDRNDMPVSTVVSIVKPGEDPDPGIVVPYHSYGELDETMVSRLKLETPVHLCTRQGAFPEVLAQLNAEVESLRKVVQVPEVEVSMDDGEDFLVI